MEVLPCPLGILAPCLCRPVAAPKAPGYLRSDFNQLANKSFNLFASFTVSAKTKPNERWKRPLPKSVGGWVMSARTRGGTDRLLRDLVLGCVWGSRAVRNSFICRGDCAEHENVRCYVVAGACSIRGAAEPAMSITRQSSAPATSAASTSPP